MSKSSQQDELDRALARAKAAEERAKAAEARAEEERLQKEEANRKLQPTTLLQYLHDLHFTLFESFTIAPEDICSTGKNTTIDGKLIPLKVRPWEEFPKLRQGKFNQINTVLGNKQLFPLSSSTRSRLPDVSRHSAAYEPDVTRFVATVLEDPVCNVLEQVSKESPTIRDSCRFNALDFTVNPHVGTSSVQRKKEKLKRKRDQDSDVESTKQQKQQKQIPDGRCVRIWSRNEYGEVAYVYDYKAAHKLQVEMVRAALSSKCLFKISELVTEEDHDNERVRMAVVQVFDYMVTAGIAYGYLAAGNMLLFLHVKFNDVGTLYWHACAPLEEVGGRDESPDLSLSGVAQLACFSLLALEAWPLPAEAADKEIKDARLQTWKQLKEQQQKAESSQASLQELSQGKSDAYSPSDHAGDSPSQEREIRLRSGVIRPRKRQSGEKSPSPTKPYCSQDCLVGLKRGGALDEKCPNVSWHRTAEHGTRHAIDGGQFTSLVGQLLRNRPYSYCEALDRFRINGSTGVRGALFKIELPPYGYTFVGKGTESFHLKHLQHESLVYHQLESLQGDVVPVHLGLVADMAPYRFPFHVWIVHMMLMSWGGEPLRRLAIRDAQPPDWDEAAEISRSSEAVLRKGVIHCDQHWLNMLWNEERQRVMIIDFDRSTIQRSEAEEARGKRKRSKRAEDVELRSRKVVEASR